MKSKWRETATFEFELLNVWTFERVSIQFSPSPPPPPKKQLWLRLVRFPALSRTLGLSRNSLKYFFIFMNRTEIFMPVDFNIDLSQLSLSVLHRNRSVEWFRTHARGWCLKSLSLAVGPDEERDDCCGAGLRNRGGCSVKIKTKNKKHFWKLNDFNTENQMILARKIKNPRIFVGKLSITHWKTLAEI